MSPEIFCRLARMADYRNCLRHGRPVGSSCRTTMWVYLPPLSNSEEEIAMNLATFGIAVYCPGNVWGKGDE